MLVGIIVWFGLFLCYCWLVGWLDEWCCFFGFLVVLVLCVVGGRYLGWLCGVWFGFGWWYLAWEVVGLCGWCWLVLVLSWLFVIGLGCDVLVRLLGLLVCVVGSLRVFVGWVCRWVGWGWFWWLCFELLVVFCLVWLVVLCFVVLVFVCVGVYLVFVCCVFSNCGGRFGWLWSCVCFGIVLGCWFWLGIGVVLGLGWLCWGDWCSVLGRWIVDWFVRSGDGFWWRVWCVSCDWNICVWGSCVIVVVVFWVGCVWKGWFGYRLGWFWRVVW